MFKKRLMCLFLIIYSFVFGYSEQVVVSQFDIGLKNSSTNSNYKYSLTGVTKSEDIKAVNSTDLSDVIDLKKTIGESFTGSDNSDLKFNYSTGEKSIIIPVTRNTSTSSAISGSFQLTETATVSNETVTNYLIQDSIVLPAKAVVLTQDLTVSTGVKFTQTDSDKGNNLKYYKMQKYMIRISKSSVNTDYDVIAKLNGMQLANSTDTLNSKSYAQSFLDGNKNYVDFLVTADQYDKAQSISTNVGLSLKFMPGDIEVFGLPKGSYRVELYSFRYSKEVTTKGNVVITKEDKKDFSVGNTEFVEDGIDIMNFSSSEFAKIKATILTVGNTTSPSIVVSEDGVAMTANITATSGAIYLDSTSSGALAISTGGTSSGGKYYQLWDVVYTTPNSTVNTNTRQVGYKMNGVYEARTNYNVISSTAQYSDKPLYQTVFAGFKDNTFSVGTFEIDDKIMNKYSDGYRSVKTANVTLTGSSIDIGTLYKGNGSSYATMTTDGAFNWVGTTAGNSVIISKAISDSKGTFQNVNDTTKSFAFYTTTWTPNIVYAESGAVLTPTTENPKQAADTVNFSWTSPSKTSYNTTVNEDKVIFRILKASEDSETYRYKPESNSNPIKESSGANLTAFLGGTNQYFDIMFTAGEDGKLSVGDTVFNFSKDNTLQIVGLSTGDYKFQIYSLQNEDTIAQSNSSYDYRVLTYGATSPTFTIGLPILETGNFSSQNNIYLIDSIKVDSSLDTAGAPVKKVELGFIIKAEEAITSLVPATNLVAKKDEVSTTDSALNLYTNNLVTEMWNNDSSKSGTVYNNIKSAVAPITLTKATKADFQYPLDIVFLIDDSGSMQNEIDSVKNGLEDFSNLLIAKGYDVKFNLITFGPEQNTTTIGNSTVYEKYNSNYLAIFKQTWYSSVLDLVDDFDDLNANGGYKSGQEDGAWAIHYGIKKLNENGRYLNKSFQIVDASASSDQKYLPSKKWVILLTDENMDTTDLTMADGTTYSASNVVKSLSSELSAGGINLTGIYHTDVKTTNTATKTLYQNAISSTTVESTSNSTTTYYATIGSNTYTITGSSGDYSFNNGTDYQIYSNNTGTLATSLSAGTYYYISGSTTTNDYISIKTNSKNTKVTVNGANYRISNESDTNYKYFTINGTKYYILDASHNKITSTSKNTTYYYYGSSVTNTYTSFQITANTESSNWLNFKDKLNHDGNRPADYGETFYTSFALQGLGDKFSMYEMGANGEYVSSALADSISNIGIIQRWNLNYTSPFPANDGNNREVIFSLKGLSKITSATTSGSGIVATSTSALDITSKIIDGTRIYNVPQQKIDAYFMNPIEPTRQLEKINNKINLKAKAQSQYKKTVDRTLQWVNYPITKGSFIITGNYSNDGVTAGSAVSKTITSDDTGTEKITLTDSKDSLNSTWYYAEANLNATDFTVKFGKNPMNVVVKFIAETAEDSKTITLSGVSVVDKTAPQIKSISMTNITLANFMRGLKDSTGARTCTDGAITLAAVSIQSQTTDENTNGTGITALSTSSAINAKAGDSIEIGLVIDDENVKSSSGNVLIGYNNSFTTASCINSNITSTSAITSWKATIPIVDSATTSDIVKNITYKVVDGSSSPNTRIVSGNAFNSPSLISSTNIRPRSTTAGGIDYNPAGYSNYYSSTSLTTSDKNTDALAYIVVFNYDKTASDEPASYTHTYPISTSNSAIKYVSSLDGNFTFGEGKHDYEKVYVINKAGAIGKLGSGGTISKVSYDGTLSNALSVLNGYTKSNTFYIDTIAPSVTGLLLDKTGDPSLVSPLNNNSTAHDLLIGNISSSRPYKAGDTISLNGNIKEYNFMKTELSQTIVSGIAVTASGISIVPNNGEETMTPTTGAFSYMKGGTATDLTDGTDSSISPTITFTIWDKAGHSVNATVTANYDDRIPASISVHGIENSGDVKFTNDISLPLNDRSGTNYSVGLITGGSYVGDITTSGAINLTSFKTNSDSSYSSIKNSYSLIGLISFSKSGKQGVTATSKVVLDTAINDSRSSITETTYVHSGNSYEVDLTSTLSTIKELVGLSKYKISTTSNSARLLHGTVTENIGSTGIEVPLVSNYNTTATATIYSTVNKLLLASSGVTKFKLTLTDRLGNPKEIDYIVEIPNNITIIGKKSGYNNMTINTKVNNSSNAMKIKSRTE